jgi:tetratricopeptide (TPR) repeat protein
MLGFTLILALTSTVKAQQQKSLSQVETETYALYQQKDWQGLLKAGKEVLQDGIDYYYLRVRMGIAYYETGNYHQASTHFEKAIQMNSSEEYLQEYLYYAYLFAGRSAEAKVIAAGFSPNLKEKTKAGSRKFIEKLDLAYNYTGLTDQNVADGFTASLSPDLEGSQFIPNQHHYFFLGLQHDFAPGLAFYHGVSGLQASHLLYSQSEGEILLDRDYQSSVFQYYAAANILLAKGLSLTGGLHFLQVRYSIPIVTQVGQGPNVVVRENTQTDNDMLYFGSLSKRWSYVSLGASYYYGTLANARQDQMDVKLILYPKGNLNLYTVSVLSQQRQQTDTRPTTNRIVFEQQLGTKFNNHLWLEAYGTFGEMENFILNDGLVIFNRLDKITQRIGVRAIILPNPRWSITLDYTLFTNQSEFKSTGTESGPINQQEYNLQSITGILSWRF